MYKPNQIIMFSEIKMSDIHYVILPSLWEISVRIEVSPFSFKYYESKEGG